RRANPARSDDEEGTNVAITEGDVAPGDVVVVFHILPKRRAFWRERGSRLDPRQQAEMLRIGEAAAFQQRRRVERNFDDATLVGGEHRNLEQDVVISGWIDDGVVGGGFMNDVAIGVAGDLIEPGTKPAGAVPGDEIASDGSIGLAGIISPGG